MLASLKMIAVVAIVIACGHFDVASALSPSGAGSTLRQAIVAGGISQPVEVNQSLMVCNAYAYKEPLDIFRLRSTLKVTDTGPVAYKNCQDLVVPLQEGDRLDFKAGSMSVGTFYATGLPKRATTLLLVPHRRSARTLAASFDSHAFAELETSQMVVVDAYRGGEDGHITIKDSTEKTMKDTTKEAVQRVEGLNFNSVVALNTGLYQIGLATKEHPASDNMTFLPMSVSGKTKYVAMRVGVGSDDSGAEGLRDHAFPQELIVFAHSSALTTCPQLFCLFSVVACIMFGHIDAV